MSPSLPGLSGTHCVFLHACARLPALGEATSRSEVMVARARLGKETHFLRLLETGAAPRRVHFELARRSYFGKSPPKVSHQRIEVEEQLTKYRAEVGDLFFLATYVVPTNTLQQSSLVLVGKNRVTTAFDQMEVELTGARFHLKGIDVDTIEWRLVGDTVYVEISFERPGAFSDSCFVQSLERTHAAFRDLVLGQPLQRHS